MILSTTGNCLSATDQRLSAVRVWTLAPLGYEFAMASSKCVETVRTLYSPSKDLVVCLGGCVVAVSYTHNSRSDKIPASSSGVLGAKHDSDILPFLCKVIFHFLEGMSLSAIRFLPSTTKALGAIYLQCHVKPGASKQREGIISIGESVIEICISARAREGEANKAVQDLLSSLRFFLFYHYVVT